jgi:hypothetical protein
MKPDGAPRPEAGASGRAAPNDLAGISSAVKEVRADFQRLLEVRGAALGSRIRGLLFTAALFAAVAIVGAIAVSCSLVLLLVGSARGLALALGVAEPLGYMLVGGGTLAAILVFIAQRRRLGRVRLEAANRDAADRRARAKLADSTAQLSREFATPRGLLAAGLLGFGGVRAFRFATLPPLGALLISGFRLLQRAQRATAPPPERSENSTKN